ncbi:unnamed protein product [Caenorhabditis angaria]|uniref:Uncharacterized protein n=1 Tax=Caenorhabditis angaria TaxID=860376 RepID=A0A9P1IUJ4_9PELO|nr:unnamed protein product [Caenorhabditis angaria]
MPRFSNKVAIITGSSNGIGRSTAILLAKDGAKVTITGRNAERLEQTLKLILAEGVPEENVNSVVGDVTTVTAQDELIDSTIKKFGKIDILVNNAGSAVPDATGAQGLAQDIDTYDRMFALNLRSVVQLTKKAKDYIIQTKGEIINVSSIVSGAHGFPDSSFYAMSKAALDSYTRNTALELIEHGVRVNAVNPGIVVTGFLEATGAPKQIGEKLYDYFASHKACLPSKELGQPEDIANLIAFLADRPLSKYIIGQTIVADGGTTLVLGIGAHNIADILSK